MPFVLIVQTRSVQDQAIFDAKQDAEASANQHLWFLTGCFFNFFGYLFANTHYRPVPTIPLLGKSPDYVAFYTDTYIAETRKLQSCYVLNGCITSVIGQCCIYVGLGIVSYEDITGNRLSW